MSNKIPGDWCALFKSEKCSLLVLQVAAWGGGGGGVELWSGELQQRPQV